MTETENSWHYSNEEIAEFRRLAPAGTTLDFAEGFLILEAENEIERRFLEKRGGVRIPTPSVIAYLPLKENRAEP